MKWPVPYCSWNNFEQQSQCILRHIGIFHSCTSLSLTSWSTNNTKICSPSQLFLISPQCKAELHFIGSKWPSIVNYLKCHPIPITEVQGAFSYVPLSCLLWENHFPPFQPLLCLLITVMSLKDLLGTKQ